MLETNNFVVAGNAIRSASALTETTFLHVGKTLEASIGVLTRLTETFDALLTELRSEDLGRALESMALSAARISDIGRTQSHGSAGPERLQLLAGRIAERIQHMQGSIGTVASLSISAKIATTDIRASSTDFSTFPDEIARTMAMIGSNLHSFATELLPVRERIAAAHATQFIFKTRQDEATRSIPPQLLATVASINQRHRHATRASSTVSQRSEGIRLEICTIILALQIGDITRQRLEHIGLAICKASEILQTTTDTQQEGTQDGLVLDADDRAIVITLLSRLQLAQVRDTAQAFDRDVRQIAQSLSRLASEARTFRNLGAAAYGSSDQGGGTFIGELEAQVGDALKLLEDFNGARADASSAVTLMANTTKGLSAHLAAVRSLEADLRIMSLNTTLKCARVGREGLALSLVAQELRSYANEFAKQAAGLMDEVSKIKGITESLTDEDATGAAPAIAEVVQAMQDSLATLRRVGQSLGDALARLERDSDSVADLLLETRANLANHDEIGSSLLVAADALEAISAERPLPAEGPTRSAAQVLDLISRNYTMANERRVHDQLLGRADGASDAPATDAPELEDVLF